MVEARGRQQAAAAAAEIAGLREGNANLKRERWEWPIPVLPTSLLSC